MGQYRQPSRKTGKEIGCAFGKGRFVSYPVGSNPVHANIVEGKLIVPSRWTAKPGTTLDDRSCADRGPSGRANTGMVRIGDLKINCDEIHLM